MPGQEKDAAIGRVDMKPLFADTDARTEALYLALLRERNVAARYASMHSLNASVRAFLASDLWRAESPGSVDSVRLREHIASRLVQAGVLPQVMVLDSLAAHITGEEAALLEPADVMATLQVTDALEALGISYVVGGSFASTAHGLPRATNDSDLVIALRPDQEDLVKALVARLDAAFVVLAESAVDALAHQSSFSLIHKESLFKVDIFIPRLRPFELARLARGERRVVAHNPDRTAVVSSPEDTVLAKLEWYRLGNEVSEKQWTDIQGVLKIKGSTLDQEYLREWAHKLGIGDLLLRALQDAGLAGHDKSEAAK